MAIMKIRVLESCAGADFVYGKGGIYDAQEETAKDLVRGGLAEYVGSPAHTGEETAEDKTAKTKQTRNK
jgi:hypothetical protein